MGRANPRIHSCAFSDSNVFPFYEVSHLGAAKTARGNSRERFVWIVNISAEPDSLFLYSPGIMVLMVRDVTGSVSFLCHPPGMPM
jgi:hypothetical protein